MGYEIIERNGLRYAELIWANTTVEKTRFFSDPRSSFQFGLLAHAAGYQEPPHRHHEIKREIRDVQQMFVVQRGKVAVQFFDESGRQFREVVLGPGDAINLVHGTHAVKVIEDMQCISVKQGPFLGASVDKVNVQVQT